MPVLLVVGAGPGNSHAIAQRFGAEGYTVALMGRDPEHLRDGVERLKAEGVDAASYVGDASDPDPDSIRSVVDATRTDHGPISAIAFTAFRSGDVSDVLDADPATIGVSFSIGVSGLLTVVQAAMADLRAADNAAVLVVNGAVGEDNSDANGFATSFGVDGVALESAAKSKLTGLLAARLRANGIYVGELVINGTLKGSPNASPTAIDPADVANTIWNMSIERGESRAFIAESA